MSACTMTEWPHAIIEKDMLYALEAYDTTNTDFSTVREWSKRHMALHLHDEWLCFVPFNSCANCLCDYVVMIPHHEKDGNNKPYWLRYDVPWAVYRRLL